MRVKQIIASKAKRYLTISLEFENGKRVVMSRIDMHRKSSCGKDAAKVVIDTELDATLRAIQRTLRALDYIYVEVIHRKAK